ncbi:MAG: trigger factor [Lachnospiraceae bacterium]|nr:trigger factor [Lachnospiraceae bacterium]
MSLQVEKLEKNMAKLTIEVSAEELEKAIEKAYQKNKSKLSVPGFRKGKVPRKMVEKMYGAGVFYEDAANDLIPTAYEDALKENEDLDIVSQPSIDVVQLEAGKPFIFTAEVALKPEVTLGDYKGIEVEKTDVTVSDEEVDAEINKERESNARTITIEDRPVADGDVANIDFEGFVDGEAFEGGKGEGYDLTIGSHSFIDTFEDQLIGKNIGDSVDVNVTFPEEYHAPDLAGKPALFKVTINSIQAKELPELDDDFAQDVSEFDTMDEYKADVKAKLEEKKKKDAENEKEDAVIAKIVENATMEIPDAMIDTQTRQMVQDFAQRLQMQGLSFEQYMQFTGTTVEQLLDQMKPQAQSRIESRLVLEAVVVAENIEATEDEFKEEMEKMASMYQMEVDKLIENIGDYEKKNIMTDIAVNKAAKFVVEAAVEK